MTVVLCQQGNGKAGLPGAGAGAAPHGPAAPAPTPRPDGSSPEGPAQQGAGMGDMGQGGGPLQELASSMRAGQLGHKMNDSDVHDQLVSSCCCCLMLSLLLCSGQIRRIKTSQTNTVI